MYEIGLDFSTTSTGMTLFKNDKYYVYLVNSKKKTSKERVDEITKKLLDILEGVNVHEADIYIESTFMGVNKKTGLILSEAQGYLKGYFANTKPGINFISITNGEWSKPYKFSRDRKERKLKSLSLTLDDFYQKGNIVFDCENLEVNDDMADSYLILKTIKERR